MKKTPVFLISILLTYAGIVSAHGPTRKKVLLTQEIAAPADKVWNLTGNFQDMSWHPAVVSTEGEGGNQPGATRTLIPSGGGEIFEKLGKYDADNQSLFYRIEQVLVQ